MSYSYDDDLDDLLDELDDAYDMIDELRGRLRGAERDSADRQANFNRMADLLADREATLVRLREELEKEREESADAIDALRRDLATARLENEVANDTR